MTLTVSVGDGKALWAAQFGQQWKGEKLKTADRKWISPEGPPKRVLHLALAHLSRPCVSEWKASPVTQYPDLSLQFVLITKKVNKFLLFSYKISLQGSLPLFFCSNLFKAFAVSPCFPEPVKTEVNALVFAFHISCCCALCGAIARL